jgi:hypothetical protein
MEDKKDTHMDILRNKIYSYLIDQSSPQSAKTSHEITYLYLILIITAYSLYHLAFNPWSTNGEMWAEMATNYFKYSKESLGISNLLLPDHGYIPLSQRIIAYTISLFNFSSSITAYLYTWCGIITSAILVGTFSLHYFRPLVSSDLSRIIISAIVLLALDWETSNFINFSYLNVFFIAIFTALALKNKAPDAPLIAYLIPILSISKVYVLTAIPVLALALFCVKPRYKKIFIITLIFASVHMLYITHSFITEANYSQGQDFTLLSKLLSSFYFFFIYLSRDLIGFENFNYLQQNIGNTWLVLTGLSLSLFALLTIFFKKSKSSPFIVIGISIAFGTAFLNAFANSPSFSIQNPIVSSSIYRHVITAFIGFILIYTGLLITWTQGWPNILRRYAVLFGAWTWITLGEWYIEPSKNLQAGFLVSKWQQNAHLIDNAYQSKPCVPLDPYPWVYNYGPAEVNEVIHCDYISKLTFGTGRYKVFGKNNTIDIPTSVLKKNHGIKSLMSAAKSYDNSDYILTMEVNIVMQDGKQHRIFGQGGVHSADSMIFLTSKENIFISTNLIKKMTLTFNMPAIIWSDEKGIPIFSWMGIKQ